jgi:hypothetical protein
MLTAFVIGDRVLTSIGTGNVESIETYEHHRGPRIRLDNGAVWAFTGNLSGIKLLESPARTVRATPGFVSPEYAERAGAAKRRGRP